MWSESRAPTECTAFAWREPVIAVRGAWTSDKLPAIEIAEIGREPGEMIMFEEVIRAVCGAG